MASTSHNNCTDNLISSFTASLKSDLDSPVTSNFGNHIADYHTQVQNIAEQIENDASEFERLRKISKDIEDGIGTLAKQLNAFAQVSKELAEKWTTKSENDTESDAAIALLKMELFMRNESELMNGQLRNWHNNMVHPLDLLVKSPNELKIKNVDKACREYDSKFVKTENETRKIAKQCGYTRSQLSHGELAEQLSKERIFVEYELCKFMLGADSFEDKRGAQLFRHFMELFRSQDIYYKERLKLNEHFRSDLERLEERMQARNATRCQQRNALFDLKTCLETHSEIIRNASGNRQMSRADSLLNRSSLSQSTISGSTDKSKQKLISSSANKTAQSQSNGSNADKSMLNQSAHHKVALTPMNQVPLNMSTSVHQQQQQQSSNDERIDLNGYLFKKTNNKLHKLWQKRRCRLHDGYFCISHSDESLAPVTMDLRISDCKPSADDPKAFDFYCRDRTYHLQAETEALLQQWILALKQEMERVKSKMLTSDDQTSSSVWLNQNASTERDTNDQLCINTLKALPGNLRCADCSSTKQVEWLSNIGSLVCIACSGVHRELGVHISRIHSIDLDVISAVEYLVPLATGNTLINRIFEYNETSCAQWKPTAECTRSDRQRFIQYKYRDRCYIEKVEQADRLFCDALRELDVEKAYRALLSPSLTSLPFEVNGPFQTLIQKTKAMSLVIAQLVVQLRIGLPSLESILVDCVNNANIDLLIILLQSHAFNSLLSNGFSLEPLERLAHKLGHHNIVELLCSVQSPERTLFKQFTIPALLISQASQSDSLSASSSSSSHLPNTNAEVDLITTNEQNSAQTPSAQIDVLMRNGTTIPVER
ncbi:unnamed protein product, partial [Anisakis simplex]|uniref:Arf-GAP with coiled-coil, ANK repeat and PH domain-containing protein 2 n=1 Tax=Anisakis simplex TaxID=6269 RepID=A0A0M3IZ10_ANISI